MLDVPLRRRQHDGRRAVRRARRRREDWTVDEQNFAISVANLIVVAIAEEERRNALARLAESEARARLIVDTAHDAFIGIDSDGQDRRVERAGREAPSAGRATKSLGRNLAETIIPPAFREAHTTGMRRFHETGEAPVRQSASRADGARIGRGASSRSSSPSPSPMRVENGFFFGAFLRDISDRRERDAELRRAKESAEAATRAKSEFLANMSHELRTPLNGVLGYAQLLQRDRTLNAAQREALEAIAKCGSQLLDLINDVLDLSKIEAGRLDIEEAPTDLTTLLTDLSYVVAEAAERKGLRLTMSIGADVPRCGRPRRPAPAPGAPQPARQRDQVHGGRRGAAAHHPRRRRAAGASRSATPAPASKPEALTEIFAAFAQTKAGAAAGGTGLGLTICDHLITKMGGDLKVESVLGEGSRFWFTLPLVQATRDGRLRSIATTQTAAPPLDARLAPGEAAHRAGRRRQHGQPPHPGRPARERRRPRHHGGWRPRSDRAGAGASTRGRLHGPQDERPRRPRSDAPARHAIRRRRRFP